MDGQTILGLGEWAGSIAVFLTLFYLAKQIRQQNNIAEYNVWNSLSQEHKRTCEHFIHDPSVFHIYRRGLDEPETLDLAESTQFQFVIQMLYNDVLKAWQAHRKGLLPDEDWYVQAGVFAKDLDTPGGRIWRAESASVYPDLFAAIDEFVGSGLSLNYQKPIGDRTNA